MLTPVCQRHRGGLARYRPAGEPFDPRDFDVEPIPDDRTARRFVRLHHYSRSYPAARFRFGLFERGGALAGVAVFSVPARASVTTNFFEGDPLAHIELGRFVLLDRVRANAETWMIARCFRLLEAAGIEAVVSFADPAPRRTADGRTVHPGHIGTIYQAKGAAYAGRSTPRILRLLPDGRVFSDRAAAKLRALDRGHDYAAAQLVASGADAPRPDEDLRAWADHWIPRVTRPMRHPGNHRYLFTLRRGRLRGHVRPQPYPKLDLFGLAT